MSLIDELRGVEPKRQTKHKPRHITHTNVYEPLWLKMAMGKGFRMSKETLQIEEMECYRKERKSFDQWLQENNLRIKHSCIDGHFLIYK